MTNSSFPPTCYIQRLSSALCALSRSLPGVWPKNHSTTYKAIFRDGQTINYHCALVPLCHSVIYKSNMCFDWLMLSWNTVHICVVCIALNNTNWQFLTKVVKGEENPNQIEIAHRAPSINFDIELKKKKCWWAHVNTTGIILWTKWSHKRVSDKTRGFNSSHLGFQRQA